MDFAYLVTGTLIFSSICSVALYQDSYRVGCILQGVLLGVETNGNTTIA
jgi:hypothetical protein